MYSPSATLNQRNILHKRIRRQQNQQSNQLMMIKRLDFMQQSCGSNDAIFEGQLQRFAIILSNQSIYKHEIIEILQTLNNSRMKEYVDSEFIIKVINIAIAFSKQENDLHYNGIQNPIQYIIDEKITTEVSRLIMVISGLQDQYVNQYLDIIFKFAQSHELTNSIMTNISLIQNWEAKRKLKDQFILICIKRIKEKTKFCDQDIEIVRGWSQSPMQLDIVYQFIEILNQYFSSNWDHVLKSEVLKNCYHAMQNMILLCPRQDKRKLKSDIVDCDYISRQTLSILQSSKDSSLIHMANQFLSEMFTDIVVTRQFLEKQPKTVPIILNLLLKKGLSIQTITSACFTLTQSLIIPNISNQFYQQISSKISHLFINFQTSPKLIEQISFIFCLMLKTLKYKHIVNYLKDNNDVMFNCLQSDNRQIKKRVMQAIQNILNMEFEGEDCDHIEITATQILVNKYDVVECLQVWMNDTNSQISKKAEKLLDMFEQLSENSQSNLVLD